MWFSLSSEFFWNETALLAPTLLRKMIEWMETKNIYSLIIQNTLEKKVQNDATESYFSADKKVKVKFSKTKLYKCTYSS